MKNILVSGTSGIVGYGILRSLRRSGEPMNLIGITMYDDSVAQGFCDVFEQAVPTNDPKYLEWLLSVIRKHQVDLLIPGIEADMYAWAEHVSEIKAAGAIPLLNSDDLVALCKDKWMFYENLKKHNTDLAIESTLTSDFDALVKQFGLPFLLKPKRGFGSKGIARISSRDEYLPFEDKVGTVLIAQEFVGNDEEEFTTSAFCDGQGGFYCFMTLRRKLSKDGFTDKAEVAEPDGIEEAIVQLCKIYRPVGPTNFQFRRHQGKLKLLEINPRISSSTSIRAAFGYNESLMAVEYFMDQKTPAQPLIRKGRAVRYVDDFIFYL